MRIMQMSQKSSQNRFNYRNRINKFYCTISTKLQEELYITMIKFKKSNKFNSKIHKYYLEIINPKKFIELLIIMMIYHK